MMTKNVVTNWTPQNEYTRPLEGRAVYRNGGIIKAVTKTNIKISVGKIVYEKYDEENFQYIISPFWNIIDGLSTDVFQGIPGLDMELRLRDYYRVNYEPVFITERSPSKNREDLWELMESVGLDYYDRFEWLIRTDMRAGNDNLIVERMRDFPYRFYYSKNEKKINFEIEQKNIFVEEDVRSEKALKRMLSYAQYDDELIVSDINQLGSNSEKLASNLLDLIYVGINVRTLDGKWKLEANDFGVLIPLLKLQTEMNAKRWKDSQKKGIENAKAHSKYKGRKKKAVDFIKLEESYKKFKSGEISIEEAMVWAEIDSKSTYYRRVRELLEL